MFDIIAQQSLPTILSNITPDTLADTLAAMSFLEENDEYADFASGNQVIDASLSDDEDMGPEAVSDTTVEDDAVPQPLSFSSHFLSNIKSQIVKEIDNHGQPQCYRNGDFFIRAKHPCFALQKAGARGFEPDVLYTRDVFVWLPELLVTNDTVFKCHCGKKLSKNGMNYNTSQYYSQFLFRF